MPFIPAELIVPKSIIHNNLALIGRKTLFMPNDKVVGVVSPIQLSGIECMSMDRLIPAACLHVGG
jgi:hypothetical protein